MSDIVVALWFGSRYAVIRPSLILQLRSRAPGGALRRMSWWQRHSPLISVAPGDALTATASLEAHGNLHDEYAARVVARRTGQKFNSIANQRRRSLWGPAAGHLISFRRDSSSRVE
jgi:hypothetical protein